MMDPSIGARPKKKRRETPPVIDEKGFRLRSGCFPVRVNTETNAYEVLLVSNRSDPTRFDVSAGGIDPGEIAAEAAMRGTRERAGVVGRLREPEKPLGVWTTQDRHTKTSIFVLDVLQELENWDEEDRTRKWFSVPEGEQAVKWNSYTAVMFNSLKIRLGTPIYAIPPQQPAQTSSTSGSTSSSTNNSSHHAPTSPTTAAIVSDLRQLASSVAGQPIIEKRKESETRPGGADRDLNSLHPTPQHGHQNIHQPIGSPLHPLGDLVQGQLMMRAAAAAEEMGVMGIVEGGGAQDVNGGSEVGVGVEGLASQEGIESAGGGGSGTDNERKRKIEELQISTVDDDEDESEGVRGDEEEETQEDVRL